MLKSGSFDACKKAAAPIIAMLGHLEIKTKVLNMDMEIIESDNCREVLENNRDANRVLAMMWEGARFSCKDGQKLINLFIQSISKLC